MEYTLGLDIGTTSVGWAILNDVPVEGDTNIIAGVRIFPEGVERDKGFEKPLNQDRREKRGMRRQHERKARRKRKLGAILRRVGMLPETREEMDKVLISSPYVLRKRGLDEDLTLHEFGRVLLHFGQRRGFKSNRKAEVKEDGVVYEGISAIKQGIASSGARTLGEYLAGHEGEDNIRGNYTSRDLYLQEFDLLWERQSQAHPQVLTPQLRQRIHDSIFFQRPLKPSDDKIGYCELEKTEKRCPRASWYAQEFRLLKEVNDLQVMDGRGNIKSLDQQQRVDLLKELHTRLTNRKEVKIERVRRVLGLLDEEKLNFEQGKRASLLGNAVEFGLLKIFGERFIQQQDFFIGTVFESLIEEEEDEFKEKSIGEWGFTDDETGELYKLLNACPKGYLRLSKKAIQKMLPYLRQGDGEYDARKKAGYLETTDSGVVMELLPPPDTVHQQITNPIVRKALVEVRKVVNAIIREYGKPTKILVELARETKGSASERNELLLENSRRKAERERIRQLLIEQGISQPSGTDILKYQLWQECKEVCAYTGRPISFHQLFGSTPEVQIEHILPYSRSLDDSQANKTLCFVDENIRKGDRTPYEAYGGSQVTWETLLENIQRLPYRKRKKFTQKEIDLDKCVERQLNDTRYINRQVRSYLSVLGVDVNVTRGQVTAELRWRWGLNTILNPDGDEKSRDDHRHHAVDAIVIGLTTSKHLKNLARKYEYKNERREFPPPWEGFRSDTAKAIGAINVSYRPTRKITGGLHEETNYGKTEKENQFVYRKPLESLTPAMIEKIRDPRIRELVRERLRECGGNTKRAFDKNNPLYMPNKEGLAIPIKKVRILTEETGLIPIQDESGKTYRFVKPGNNHHISIFEYEVNGRKKREGVVMRMIEAAGIAMENGRRRRQHLPDLPIVRRVHPERPDARFIMSLQINDIVKVQANSGEYELWTVQKMDINQNIVLRPLNYAGKREDTDKPPLIMRKKPNTLRGEKVTVDPLGKIYPAND